MSITAGRQVATNLANMARNYKTSDPVQGTAFRVAFKEQSKNDLVRTIVYLLEVVGSNDVANKYLQGENKDLRELLKLNNIDPDKEIDEDAPLTPSSDPGANVEQESKADAPV